MELRKRRERREEAIEFRMESRFDDSCRSVYNPASSPGAGRAARHIEGPKLDIR